MAFSADELRVLRRALAEVLHPSRTAALAAPSAAPAAHRPAAEHVQDYLRLAGAVDDAVQEAGRLRAFLADNDVRLRLEAHMPAPRRLLALPGTSAADDPDAEPARKPVPRPGPAAPPAPGAPKPSAPEPGRRTPTPAEIWPPGRRPAPDPPRPDERAAPAVLAALVRPRRAC